MNIKKILLLLPFLLTTDIKAINNEAIISTQAESTFYGNNSYNQDLCGKTENEEFSPKYAAFLREKKGMDALSIACKKKDYDVIASLFTDLQTDDKIKNKYKNLAVHYAAGEKNPDLFKSLLNLKDKNNNKIDININIKDHYGISPFQRACECGGIGVVKLIWNLLKDKGIDINAQDKFGNTPLIEASGRKHINTLEFLLKNGANPDIENNLKKTALHYAVQNNYSEMIDPLVNHPKIDINAQDIFKKTALIIAASLGHLEIVKLLLKHPDININLQDKNGNTAFIKASGSKRINTLEFLLKNGANPDIENNLKKTAFIYACENNCFKAAELLFNCKNIGNKEAYFLKKAYLNNYVGVIKFLLNSKGIAVRFQENQIKKAFYYSLKKNHLDAAKLLFDYHLFHRKGACLFSKACRDNDIKAVKCLLKYPNIDVNLRQGNNGDTALIIAAFLGHLNIVKILLDDSRTDVNIQNKNKHSALLVAASSEHLNIVKLLLDDSRTDVNIQDKNKNSALLIAASFHGHLNMVKLLLDDSRTDVNIQDIYESNALIIAAGLGHLNIVKLLLDDPRTDVNIQNKSKNSALLIAAGLGHLNIVKLLLDDSRTDVNIQDKNKNSALLIALSFGNLNMVKLLLDDSRTDVNLQDIYGKTAFTYAIEKKRSDIAQLIAFRGYPGC